MPTDDDDLARGAELANRAIPIVSNGERDAAEPQPKAIKPTGEVVMQARLTEISRLEQTMKNLSDAELQRKTQELKDRLRDTKAAVFGP